MGPRAPGGIIPGIGGRGGIPGIPNCWCGKCESKVIIVNTSRLNSE